MSVQTGILCLVAVLALFVSSPAGFAAEAAPPDTTRSSLRPDPPALVAPSRPYDTLHTKLDLDLDLETQRIAGSVTHEMTSLREGLTEFWLNCVGLEVDRVQLNGEDVSFDYPVPGDQSTSWFESAAVTHAADRLVIRSRRPLARGEAFTVEVQYHGEPKEGLYWIRPEKGLPGSRFEVWSQGEGENTRYWIPCHDYPDDRATFEAAFRVKDGNYVLSNGILTETGHEGGRTVYRWRQEEPIVTYLLMVAAGNYEVFEDRDGRVPLLYVVPPGTDRATVDRSYGRTRDMILFFEQETGIAYPWKKYAQVVVQDFLYGGMENVSATTMNMRTLQDERGPITRSNEGLIAHELAHQWWGDLVTCREWSHMWLNEGFASYYQSLYREHAEGEEAFRYEMYDRIRATIVLDKTDPRPLVTDFFNRRDARNANNVYDRGAALLHMIRYLLGDADFRAVIRHYGEAFQFGLAGTMDLARAIQDVTGENLDWLFEEWAYLAGHPRYRVTKSWDGRTGLLQLTVNQTQTVGGLIPLFRMPVDLEVTCAETTRTIRIPVDRAEQNFYVSLPSEPRMVIFDKGDWILKELDFPKPAEELAYQLAHGDYISRVRAAEALGHAGAESWTVAALRDALGAEGHYGLRREAALALGKIGTTEARDALVEALRTEDGRVRMACAEALGGFEKDRTAEEVLFRLLRTDPGYGVRAKAVASLVTMASPRAAAACREALAQESDQNIVRNAGLDGLVKLEESSALGLVKQYTGPGNERNCRHPAIAAYASLARQLPREGERKAAAAYLAGMLDDWYLRTRREVITALGTLGEKSAIPALRRRADGDPVEDLRVQAAKVADTLESPPGKKPDTRAVDVELQELRDRLRGLERELEEMKSKWPAKEAGTSPP